MPPDFNRNAHCLLGLPFDAVDMDEAEQKIRAAIESRTRCFFSTPNLNFLMACRKDAEFRQSLLVSDLVVADGMPLIWLARLLGLPIRHRVAGASLFERLRAESSGKPIRVYFFGGPDGAAEAACNKINSEDGGMQCVGFISPGFGSVADMSSPAILEAINESEPDLLVVSLGARKGQAWITRNLTSLNTPVISHLGAVVNFVGGSVKRAPPLVQDLGLEWLWRIKEEPQLWKRYIDDGFGLTRLLVKQVAPQLLNLRANRSFPNSSNSHSEINAITENFTTKITLKGTWTCRTLQPLRDCIDKVASIGNGDVTLDLEAVTHIDSSFIGLILLLSGHQTSHKFRLNFEKVPEGLINIMNQSGAEFLQYADVSNRH